MALATNLPDLVPPALALVAAVGLVSVAPVT